MLPDENGNLNTDNNKDKECEDDNKNKLNITIEEYLNGNDPPYHHNDEIGKTAKDATLPLSK